MTGQPAADPFRALGLQPRPGLTDDEVHAAWRRTASATHPDREDGGDPQRFADAAAAYTALRTRFGRGEVLADLAPGRGVATGSERRRVPALLAGSRVWPGVRPGWHCGSCSRRRPERPPWLPQARTQQPRPWSPAWRPG